MLFQQTPQEGRTLKTLSEMLKEARLAQGWSLREAERRTGVHNAHLSQIEQGSIARPDPNILYALATAYSLNYERLLRLAGHIKPGASGRRRSPYGAVAWKTLTELTNDEQRQVVEFMAELQRRSGGGSRDQ